MTKRTDREPTDWAGLLIVVVLMCATTIVLDSVGRIGATIGDLGVGHGAGDIVVTLLAVVVVAVLVWSFAESRKARFTRASTYEEEREERRAWLADLRDQGLSGRQLLVQRLSMTLAASTVMALRRTMRARRNFDGWTRIEVIHWFAAFAVGSFSASQIKDGFDWRTAAVQAVMVLLFDRIGCLVVRRRDRKLEKVG